MRIITLAVAIVLVASTQAAAKSELECLTEAVLAESTLANEPIEADQVVAYSIERRKRDGRWGANICTVVNKRYAKTEYRWVKVFVKKKEGKHKARYVRKAFTTYTYDYSYKGIEYYKNILLKSSPKSVARARLVAEIQLAGEYTPPDGFEDALHFMYREHSSKNGIKWFKCTAKPLGRVHPKSVHVMYRDATHEELGQTREQYPECSKLIDVMRENKLQNETRRQLAHTE